MSENHNPTVNRTWQLKIYYIHVQVLKEQSLSLFYNSSPFCIKEQPEQSESEFEMKNQIELTITPGWLIKTLLANFTFYNKI